MASAEQTQQLEPLLMGYPVDAITESQHCHLMTQWMELKVKAAVGSVLPNKPDSTYHGQPIL